MSKSRRYVNGKYVPNCCWYCDPPNKRKEYPNYELDDYADELLPYSFIKEDFVWDDYFEEFHPIDDSYDDWDAWE